MNQVSQPHHDNLRLAVAAILITSFALSLGDALIKQESSAFPLWQIFVMRSVIATPFLVYFIRIRTSTMSIMPERFGWIALRSLILVGMWVPMWIAEWRVMAILAAAIIVGSIGASIAYQSGPSSIIATFDFSYVAFAIIWGILLFSEVPGFITIIGIVLIVGGGMLAVRNR